MANQLLKDIQASFRSENPITRLITINIAVFIIISLFRILGFFTSNSMIIATMESAVINNLSLPLNFTGFFSKPWTLFTYMFTHIELSHIFWNMLTLYWFGKLLAYYTATKKIIPLYLLGGITGGLVTMLIFATVPMFKGYAVFPLIGASAGVTAIIVATATLIPEVKMNLLLIGPVKLLYVAVFVIFIDVLNVAYNANVGGNIAHLGGALMGYFFIIQYKRGRDMSSWMNRFFDWVKGLFKPKANKKLKVIHKRSVPDEEYNMNRKASQQTVDEILDKISKSGYDSLSKAEKEILHKASNKI